MAIFNYSDPFGFNINNNPLIVSPFVAEQRLSDITPPSGQSELLTEGGDFIMTEGNDFITTE